MCLLHVNAHFFCHPHCWQYCCRFSMAVVAKKDVGGPTSCFKRRLACLLRLMFAGLSMISTVLYRSTGYGIIERLEALGNVFVKAFAMCRDLGNNCRTKWSPWSNNYRIPLIVGQKLESFQSYCVGIVNIVRLCLQCGWKALEYWSY